MTALTAKWKALPERRRAWIRRSVGIALGAGAGYLYYATVGCSTGACPISSNPWISTGWGALIGLSATY